MAKKAFCVGINEYPYEGFDLKGCVNDATTWADLLINHFDFPDSDVKIITNAEATRRNIVKGIHDLLIGAKPGDILVFTNSSHGSYLANLDQDEDQYDEVICPYDIKDNILVDDELRELFSAITEGVKLTVISDSCHSGTITRLIPGRDERRKRFLNPSLRGDPELEDPILAKPRRYGKYPESGMREILITGCKDIEFSYDAKMGEIFHGAMSYSALQTIREANYKITYAELVKQVNRKLKTAGFPQHSQLEGKAENKNQSIFI